jgi:hypothetical protein
VIKGRARPWTEEEQQKLFDIYFSSGPGVCPVCSQEVNMVMSYLGQTVTLLMTCDGCSNKAQVNRLLPLQGPLPGGIGKICEVT